MLERSCTPGCTAMAPHLNLSLVFAGKPKVALTVSLKEAFGNSLAGGGPESRTKISPWTRLPSRAGDLRWSRWAAYAAQDPPPPMRARSKVGSIFLMRPSHFTFRLPCPAEGRD